MILQASLRNTGEPGRRRRASHGERLAGKSRRRPTERGLPPAGPHLGLPAAGVPTRASLLARVARRRRCSAGLPGVAVSPAKVLPDPQRRDIAVPRGARAAGDKDLATHLGPLYLPRLPRHYLATSEGGGGSALLWLVCGAKQTRANQAGTPGLLWQARPPSAVSRPRAAPARPEERGPCDDVRAAVTLEPGRHSCCGR